MIDELLQLSRAGERGAPGERLALAQLATSAGDERSGAAWLSRVGADRVLDALVENALAYSPPGSAVEVVATNGGLEVRDRGPGLAADELDQVFERFHRGDAGRSGVPGTGLGLPIARELVRHWGGEVTLRARAGAGTVADVRLPPA
jgi:signal transduction histidine kinase